MPGKDQGEAAVALTSLTDGESGRVVALSCDQVAIGKLEAMGILVGVEIEKRSSSLRRGPVVVGRGSFQMALAHSIAKGILVEPLGPRSR